MNKETFKPSEIQELMAREIRYALNNKPENIRYTFEVYRGYITALGEDYNIDLYRDLMKDITSYCDSRKLNKLEVLGLE